MSIIFKPPAGREISSCVSAAIDMAHAAQDTVELIFNEKTVHVHFSYARHLLEELEAQ